MTAIQHQLIRIAMIAPVILCASPAPSGASPCPSETEKLARVLVHYSLALKQGDELFMLTDPAANELNLAVYGEAITTGAHVTVITKLPGQDEIYFRHARGRQLDHVSPLIEQAMRRADAILSITAKANTRSLAGVDKARLQRKARAAGRLSKIAVKRIQDKTLRYCETSFPTQASAQEAGMGLLDHRDFVFNAARVRLADPIASWRQQARMQQRLVDWLRGRDRVTIKGKNAHLGLSIKGRTFLSGDGKINFPDGEIFTSPVERSVNGWVRFTYPHVRAGQEIVDAKLWIKNGKVVRFEARRGKSALGALLRTDVGASTIGELGIGMNNDIKRFSGNMLFDEKMGGTIHLALGRGFPQAGGTNTSAIHVDLLTDLSDGEIRVDGQLLVSQGKLAR